MTVEKRDEHCAFAVLDKQTGKCIAACHLNNGDTDCIGKKRRTMKEYVKQLEKESGLH